MSVIIRTTEDLLRFTPDPSLEKIISEGFIHPSMKRDETYMKILSRDQLLEEDTEAVRRVLHFLRKLWTSDEDYGGFKILDIPKNANITLEISNSFFPLCMLRYLKVPSGRIGTLIYRCTEEFIRRYQPTPLISSKPLDEHVERLIIGENMVIDCTGLSVHQLVLFNPRSALNIGKAKNIHTLVIVHGIGEKIRLPTCPGIRTLVLPQEQEIEYTFMKTKLPPVMGFIPSKFEPSAFARGVQLAREPFEKSRMEEEVFDLYTRAFIKTA